MIHGRLQGFLEFSDTNLSAWSRALVNTWMDLNKVTLYYQCFTLTAKNAKTANPQRATGVRDMPTILYQTRDDMEWLLGSKILLREFSEYTVVDIAHLVKISLISQFRKLLCSAAVSHRYCISADCGSRGAGVGAAWKVANVEEGSTVAVFGLGAVGLALPKELGCVGPRRSSVLISILINSSKKFGFTDFVNPTLCGEKKVSEFTYLFPQNIPKKVIKEMTGGGVDYSFECVGLPSILSEAFISTRTGSGKTVMLGMGKHAAPISLGSFDLLSGRTICGSLFGGLKSKLDIPVLVDHYLKKELNLDSFITHELKFQEINKAFELLEEGKSLRCIIWMDK
ncbi:hypothetical protein HID58_071375 [Brassica napus]|uniref:Alcohol dehydrogenase-like C-terminal domain-containing protein n=1 Tax=Brassica napus TaxID=3708 RepID=A0ABQ7Z1I0_BRANA|nr:hypothetical protein HID58_071375 [Brassica napus]